MVSVCCGEFVGCLVPGACLPTRDHLEPGHWPVLVVLARDITYLTLDHHLTLDITAFQMITPFQFEIDLFLH